MPEDIKVEIKDTGKGIDKEALKRVSYLNLEYPSGCLLAKGILEDCIPVDQSFREKLSKKDPLIYKNILKNTSWKGYAFHIKNIEKINPIPSKGKLSLWEYKK